MSMSPETYASADAGAVDRSQAVPLYHQIYMILRDEILSGRLANGAPVPTEQDLVQIYSVSRITARRVLDELAQSNLVVRKRRVGTRVSFQSPSKPIEADIDQAVESLLTFGRNTKVELIELAEEPARPPATDALGLQPGDTMIRAARVRWQDDEPLGYVLNYLPGQIGRMFSRSDFTDTPVLGLLERAGIKIGRGSQTIFAVAADPHMARALAVEPRSPLLVISRVVCDEAGTPVLLTLAHYRPDRYHIRLDLQPHSK